MKRAFARTAVAAISLAANAVLAAVSSATPPAPDRYAQYEVLNYSASAAKLPAGHGRLLGVVPSGSAAEVSSETWVVRSAANTNRTFAVRRARLASGGISMCAYSPNRVLATLAAGKSYASFVQEMTAKGLHVVRELMRDLEGNAVYVIEATETENDIVEQMTMSIEETGSCTMVRPDSIYEANAVPNDPGYIYQWGLEKIGAPQAWDTRTDASSVLVAVLDTGVNYNHRDLLRNLWLNDGEIPGDGIDNDSNGIVDDVFGMSSVGGNVSGNPMDDNGHGSHCAGIIGAEGNNRGFVSGVAWKAKIMALKFLDNEGSGFVSDAVTCLRYAEDHGVKIVNCSFGQSGTFDDYLYIQMKKMSQQGTVFVCAAGNAEPGTSPRDNDEFPFYPCNYSVDTLVAVAATDRDDALANFSYYGAQNVDIAAPGVDVYSTVLDSSLGYKSGTSMATPHVAGALALLMAHYPSDTSAQIISRLYAAAEPIPALTGKVRTGARLSMAGFFGIAPPTEISVSQGTVNDAVVLYWTAVDSGTHYRVWRADTEDGEKSMICDWRQALTFSDETAEPGVTYWYFLQSASSAEGAKASTFSRGESGFRPVIDTSRITVSFDAAGGTVTPASKVYRIGETYAELPTPAYSGKAFLGWFTAASGGTRLDEPSLVRADATTLHAHWTASDALHVENLFARQRYPWNGYVDVTFDLFGVPDDDTASVSLTASEEGGGSPLALRTFVGSAPTNLVNGAQHVVWNATPDTQGILYTNLILAATVAIDEKPLLPPANVSASNATDSDAVVVSWSASENATSYEVWRATANSSASAAKIASPATASYRDVSAVPAATYWYWVKAVNSKKTSDFSASASGSRKKVATGLTISGPASVTVGETATYTCTATYNDNSTAAVTPSWSITGGSSYATIDSSGVLSANGTAMRRSVTIQASYSYNGSTQTMTKGVTIDTKSVTISFDANGGSVSPTSQSYIAYGTYGSLPTPSVRAGYTFLGWYTESSGGTQVTTSSTVPVSATTLWAHWTAALPTWTIDEHGTLVGVDLNGATEIVIPSTVKSIGTNVFESCSDLVRVVVPQGVTNIGERAFFLCKNLEEINIPSGVACIGAQAFQWCYKLVGVSLPSSVGVIGRQAFYQCEQLAEMHIPSTVTVIGTNAFSWCSNMHDVFIEDGVEEICNGAFSACRCLTNVVMSSTIKSIGNSAFHGCPLYEFNVPQGVTNIGNSAFSSCSRLTKVVIPAGVSFDAFVFADCTRLETVILNDGVTDICTGMFEGCKNLTNIVMASTIKDIGNSAFSYCTSLKSIQIGAGVTNVCSSAFAHCESLCEAIIPSNVKRIQMWAFANCINLKGVMCLGGLDSYDTDVFGSLTGYKATPADLTTYVTSNWTGPTGTWNDRSVAFLTHTIDFDANDGSGTMANQIVVWYATSNLTANAFVRSGYTFTGWATNATGAVIYGDGARITPTEDMTLYAVWLGRPWSVSASDATSTTAVDLNWAGVEHATSYQVWRGVSSSSADATLIRSGVTDTSFSDTTVPVGTNYYYWVKAIYGSVASEFSAYDAGRRMISAPQQVTATPGSSMADITVKWSAGVTGAVRYEIWRAAYTQTSGGAITTISGFSRIASIGATATVVGRTTRIKVTSYTDHPTFSGNIFYRYYVRAVGGTDTSAKSNYSEVRTYQNPGIYSVSLPQDGNYAVKMVGGGGGGAMCANSTLSGNVQAGGGSGAGFIGVLTLSSGSYTITVGANGTGVNYGTYSVPCNGSVGGATVLNKGTSVIVSAAGGGGGSVNPYGFATGGPGGALSTSGATIVSHTLMANGNAGGGAPDAYASGGAALYQTYGRGGDATASGNVGFFQITINE